MEKQNKSKPANTLQTWVLFLMRTAIGWHFLYGGLDKLLSQGWTSRAYLASSNWFLADVYHWMSNLTGLISVVDVLNIWGQIIIGLCLMLGIYVSELVRAYHTPLKIYESFMLAEKCGINTILTHPSVAPALNQYWKQYGGKIKFIADCGWMEGTDTLGAIDYSIDNGASLCYLQGEVVDQMVKDEKWDYLNKCLEKVRRQGLPMGIGAHRIESLIAVTEKGIAPDFWMKTFHPQTYWSAKHPEWHDNKFCFNSEATIQFMRNRKEPWIAFKTMAAGAIHPQEAFLYAFENGADFICAGMYDFQMVEDANIALNVLSNGQLKRQRPWMA